MIGIKAFCKQPYPTERDDFCPRDINSNLEMAQRIYAHNCRAIRLRAKVAFGIVVVLCLAVVLTGLIRQF